MSLRGEGKREGINEGGINWEEAIGGEKGGEGEMMNEEEAIWGEEEGKGEMIKEGRMN